MPKLPAVTLFNEKKSAKEEADMMREELTELITSMIQDTIGIQSEWQAYGGEISSLRELNGNLIIKTTPANHRDIQRLLRALTPANDGSPR